MSIEIATNFEFCHKEAGFTYVACGFDSMVFKKGEIVKHVYIGAGTPEYPPPEPKTLELYFKITNRAHEIGKKGEFVFNFPYSKEKYEFQVNPFLNMSKCDGCGFFEADSYFIEGNTLEVPSARFDPKELRVVLSTAKYFFEDKLGVHGINLQPKNLKSPRSGLIIVTDLCANIPELRLNVVG